jgi:hypothetical protein
VVELYFWAGAAGFARHVAARAAHARRCTLLLSGLCFSSQRGVSRARGVAVLSGLFFGFVPGLIAVVVFILVGAPLLIVAATIAIHLRRWLRRKKNARAKAARLAARNAKPRKAPSSRERQSPPQKPARAAPRRVRVMPPASTSANGEGP